MKVESSSCVLSEVQFFMSAEEEPLVSILLNLGSGLLQDYDSLNQAYSVECSTSIIRLHDPLSIFFSHEQNLPIRVAGGLRAASTLDSET